MNLVSEHSHWVLFMITASPRSCQNPTDFVHRRSWQIIQMIQTIMKIASSISSELIIRITDLINSSKPLIVVPL